MLATINQIHMGSSEMSGKLKRPVLILVCMMTPDKGTHSEARILLSYTIAYIWRMVNNSYTDDDRGISPNIK